MNKFQYMQAPAIYRTLNANFIPHFQLNCHSLLITRISSQLRYVSRQLLFLVHFNCACTFFVKFLNLSIRQQTFLSIYFFKEINLFFVIFKNPCSFTILTSFICDIFSCVLLLINGCIITRWSNYWKEDFLKKCRLVHG